ncbi:hypothetical protein CLV60_101572 [Dyadobacter jiangsuensis]|uniref:Uncharacterized protein n=1 Tax=Dyadobacter jiangsuensis TaxID=1591085 RepID=A0A2P8GJR7_9BACT|nr:hypothetical protein CLV60_101572 [Dyadobacter jiangsuensis]
MLTNVEVLLQISNKTGKYFPHKVLYLNTFGYICSNGFKWTIKQSSYSFTFFCASIILTAPCTAVLLH